MNIIIAEAGSATNVGSMALIENAIKIAKEKFNADSVTVLCHSVNNVKDSLSRTDSTRDVKVINDLMVFPSGNYSIITKVTWVLSELLWRIWLRFLLLFTIKPAKFTWGKKNATLKAVESADLVICIGAERINDIYVRTAFLSLEVLEIYELMKKKLVHFSLTIGPVFNNYTISKASKVLDNSYAIFVRDTKSFELLDTLKVTKPYKFSSYDVAINQDVVPKETSQSILDKFKVPQDKPFIGVSVINWAFKKTEGPSGKQEYDLSFAKTLDYLIEKYGYNVVFIPTVIDVRKSADDLSKSNEIMSLMKHRSSAFVIDQLLTPSELSGVYSLSKYSIVTRMHAAILCTGAGNTPIVSVNYLYKLREYMKNIDFEDYSVDIDYITPEGLIELCEKLEQTYDQSCSKLTDEINGLRTKLSNDIDSIKPNI